MTVLEDRYRSVLRMLPASYRQVWEEEMVVTFSAGVAVDDVERAEYLADCGRPGCSEVASVAALAVRLRLGGAQAQPRSFAWGEAVRRAVLVVLLVNAVTATAGVIQTLWVTGRIGGPPVPPELAAWASLAAAHPGGIWSTLTGLGGLLWVPAFLALVVGYRRTAQACAGMAILPGLGAAVLSTVSTPTSGPVGPSLFTFIWWYMLVVGTVTVVAMAAFHREAPRLAERPWLIAFAIGVALFAVIDVTVGASAATSILVDPPAVFCLAVVIGAIWYLTRAPEYRAPAWALGLSMLGLVAVGLRVVSLLEFGHIQSQRPVFMGPDLLTPTSMTLGLIETVAMLAVTVALAVLGRRMLDQASAPAVGIAGTAGQSDRRGDDGGDRGVPDAGGAGGLHDGQSSRSGDPITSSDPVVFPEHPTTSAGESDYLADTKGRRW